MTYVDGKKIRDEIGETLKEGFLKVGDKKVLSIIYAGTSPVIDSFVALKKKFGETVGVDVVVHRFDEEIEEGELLDSITRIQKESDGVVVQLPLPEYLDQGAVLSVLDSSKDIDLLGVETLKKFLNKETKMTPPGVGAIDEIFRSYSIILKNYRIAVVGRGKLVGKPVAVWLMRECVMPIVVGEGDDLASSLLEADIVISGVGSPGLIKPEMLKDGVVLIDVGTSESGGTIMGDIDKSCGEKASLFSSVPGGVGPITIAKLFENMLY